MIRVLQDWQEVGDSISALQGLNFPLHSSPQKNWDHWLLLQALASIDRRARVADLGCGHGDTLTLLHAAGFSDLVGVDFNLSWRIRIRQLLSMKRARTLSVPYRLVRADIIRTGLESGTCDAVVCVSTIEHGVNLEAFVHEAVRLLRPSGILFISTDYWEDKIVTNGAAQAFELPWQVFSREQIKSFLLIAARAGLNGIQGDGIPPCSKRTVLWQGESYTFIALVLSKSDRAEARA
jgi:SAM-dependent methyltransferase